MKSVKQSIKKMTLKIQGWSLLPRLALFFTSFSIFAWTLTGALDWYMTTQHNKTFFDAQQVLFAKTLIGLDLSLGDDNVQDIEDIWQVGKGKVDQQILTVDDDTMSFAIFSVDGNRLLTDGEDGKDFPLILGFEGFQDMLVDDDMYRLFYYISPDKERIIVVGQEIEYRREKVFELLLNHLIPWFTLLPLLLLGLSVLLYKELRPLRDLARLLEKREAKDTSLIEIEKITPEMRPLVYSLNILFERISYLLEKERSFVSNAAHELRTPLAGLRIQAEVLEMCSDDIRAQENAAKKIIEGSERCSHLVDQLLLLSSLEKNHDKNQCFGDKSIKETINWNNLLQSMKNEIEKGGKAKSIDVEYTMLSSPRPYIGFLSLWEIVLRNLGDNALRYTPENGRIRIVLEHNKFYIENSAKHFDKEVLAMLGERFFRPAGQKETGSGLGLAIIKNIAQLHNAKIKIENVDLNLKEGFLNTKEKYGVRVSVLF